MAARDMSPMHVPTHALHALARHFWHTYPHNHVESVWPQRLYWGPPPRELSEMRRPNPFPSLWSQVALSTCPSACANRSAFVRRAVPEDARRYEAHQN
jgi:hypothetical protein